MMPRICFDQGRINWCVGRKPHVSIGHRRPQCCRPHAFPLVRVHPDTGERALLLGHFVRRILGVSVSDSRYLFDLFQSHVTRLENTVRWHWAPGDIVMWDNRATQHYAIDDYADLPRKMHRVTVSGGRAVSVTGEHSHARS
jgi:alpha-ketoglutarate-dependent sulfate ester dioxygenase